VAEKTDKKEKKDKKKGKAPKEVAEIQLLPEDEKLLDEAWQEVAKEMRDGKYDDYFKRMKEMSKKDKDEKPEKDKDEKKDKKASVRNRLVQEAFSQPRGSRARKAAIRVLLDK